MKWPSGVEKDQWVDLQTTSEVKFVKTPILDKLDETELNPEWIIPDIVRAVNILIRERNEHS